MRRGDVHVFIAGPMSTSGEPGPNLHAAASAAADLLYLGFTPFIPHVTWILHAIRPDIAVKTWQQWDRRWLQRCDCLLRLPGRSDGADREVIEMRKLERPVFSDVEEVAEHYKTYL